MALTDVQIRKAQPTGKLEKLSDGSGLQLHITPAGSKLWRGAYRFDGKQKTYSLGSYPDISLAGAREQWHQAKKLLSEGQDPGIARKQRKAATIAAHDCLLRDVAQEWRDVKFPKKSKTADDYLHRVAVNVFPDLGDMPVAMITPPMVLKCIRRIEARGSLNMSGQVQKYLRRIFDFAMASDYCQSNPAAPVKEAMRPHKPGNFAAIDTDDLPKLIRDFTGYTQRMGIQTQVAFRLMMHTFVRTSELVKAPWDEIDFERALWIVPEDRMKKGREHIVPMSRQVVELFKIMQPLSHGRKYIFPHRSKPMAHMDSNTVRRALERMGYKGKMTGHGFRALAMSTIKQELGYPHEIVDLQLAHVKKDKVDQAYDRAQWLKERTKMMQDWSDYLDAIEASVAR